MKDRIGDGAHALADTAHVGKVALVREQLKDLDEEFVGKVNEHRETASGVRSHFCESKKGVPRIENDLLKVLKL